MIMYFIRSDFIYMFVEKDASLSDSKATQYNWDKFKTLKAHQEEAPDRLSASGIELKRQKEEKRKADEAARIKEIDRIIQEELDKPDDGGDGNDGMKKAA